MSILYFVKDVLGFVHVCSITLDPGENDTRYCVVLVEHGIQGHIQEA